MRLTGYRGPGCPACTEPLPLGVSDGQLSCPACRSRLDIHVFQPVIEVGSRPLPHDGLAVDQATPCAYHAVNRAEASCDRCGVFMCGLCRVDMDGRRLCPPCFDRLANEGALPSAVIHRRNWCGMSIHLAFFSLMPFIGVLLAPAAIWTAVVGLKRNRATGERLSHRAGQIAIVLAVLGLAISGATILGLAGVFNR